MCDTNDTNQHTNNPNGKTKVFRDFIRFIRINSYIGIVLYKFG